jgi:hypothetical protein
MNLRELKAEKECLKIRRFWDTIPFHLGSSFVPKIPTRLLSGFEILGGSFSGTLEGGVPFIHCRVLFGGLVSELR